MAENIRFSSLSEILIYLRGDRSLREVETGTGISHTYISSLERGIDPRNGKDRSPSFETLRTLSNFYKVPFLVLLQLAGHFEPEDVGEYLKHMIGGGFHVS